MHDIFRRFAGVVSRKIGSGWAFMLAIVLVFGTGLYFNFSEAWKGNVSFISTFTALLLLIFLQKSQNHSDKATHLKLDELIQAAEGARNEIIATEMQTERAIEELKAVSDPESRVFSQEPKISGMKTQTGAKSIEI